MAVPRALKGAAVIYGSRAHCQAILFSHGVRSDVDGLKSKAHATSEEESRVGGESGRRV